MEMSELLDLLDEEDQTGTAPHPVALPFRPGTEIRGPLPTLRHGEGEMPTSNTVPEQYGGEVPVGTHDLWLEVVECDDELLLILKSKNPDWTGRAVWVAVGGDGDSVHMKITAKLVLKPSTVGYLAGTNFGPVAELREKFGSDLRWTVFPPRELIIEPVRDEEPPGTPPTPQAGGSRSEELMKLFREEWRKLSETERIEFERDFIKGQHEGSGHLRIRHQSKLSERDFIEDRHAEVIQGYHALNATRDVLRKSASAAREHAIERLDKWVARIRTEFWAYAVWLYVKDGETLRAIVTQNTRGCDQALPLSLKEGSIVTMVATNDNREGYYTNHTLDDQYYRTALEDTQSAMATPLITSEGELIGVLHLESLRPGAFSDELLEDLQAAAADLIPHLLVLRSLDAPVPQGCPWHPGVHKWDLVVLLGQVCHAIRKALAGAGADAIQCAIWSVDRWSVDPPQGQLYVYATSGHGEEFIRDQALSLPNSFTGHIAGCPAGSVGVVCRGDDSSLLYIPTAEGIVEQKGPPFITEFRGLYTNWRKTIAAPLHRVGSAGQAGEAWCVLGIYAEDEQAVSALPSHEEMNRLADVLGKVISAYIEQRERLAKAFLRPKISRRHPSVNLDPIFSGSNELLNLVDIEIQVLQPGGEPVEIFWAGSQQRASLPQAHLAYPIEHPWSGLPRRSTLPKAYLSYLMEHPEDPVRINNARSPRPLDITTDPGKSAERLPWNDPDHRRFLDVAVVAQSGEPLGLLRLIRSAGDRPFLPSDARVVRSLNKECAEVLQCWRPQEGPVPVPAPAPPVVSHEGNSAELWKVWKAITDFGSPVPILRCLVGYFQPYGPVHVGFAVKRPAEGAPFRWYPFRLPGRYWVNSGNPERMTYNMAGMDWERLVKNGRPITFNRTREDGDEVMSGIRMPLVAWSRYPLLAWDKGRGLVEGVLCLDFGRPIDWNPSHVSLLSHAAQRISELMAPRLSEGLQTERRPDHTDGINLKVLQQMTDCLVKQCDSTRVDVLLRHGEGYRPLMNLPADIGLSETTWEHVRSDLDYGSARFGVEVGMAAGRHVLQVPLYLGSFRAGLVRCDLGDRFALTQAYDQNQSWMIEARHQVIDVISGFWTHSIGTHATSNLQFSEDRCNGDGGELIGWNQTVVWPPSLIG